MISVKDAQAESYAELTNKLFDTKEIERASSIAKVLDGMTIEDAQTLLDKMKCFVAKSIFIF